MIKKGIFTINKRSIGTAYEIMAADYLITQGLEVLQRNYRCRMGEIDLVCREGQYLVFCEVKFRTSNQFGYPSEAVTASKIRTIHKVAQYYMMEHHLKECFIRFDVIAILGDSIEHIRNAF